MEFHDNSITPPQDGPVVALTSGVARPSPGVWMETVTLSDTTPPSKVSHSITKVRVSEG